MRESVDRGTLPSSILFHGPRGVGKQRLGLWLAQLLLCEGTGSRPCGACRHCRFAEQLSHPDIHWYFPRPRLKESDSSPEEVRADLAEAIAERRERNGLYAAPEGDNGIFVSTIRALVRNASMTPAIGRRKVFIVGDAERMVSQEGADQAANAFLKLLEEPPADTTLILTSSEPGALLPTIRSRVVAIRVGPLGTAEVRSFVADPLVAASLKEEGGDTDFESRVRVAQGAPGQLFGGPARAEAAAQARRLIEGATARRRADVFRAVFTQGKSKARGGYAETLDAMTQMLHQRVRESVPAEPEAAIGAARAVETVERAKILAYGNVNPLLISASVVRELRQHLS